MALTDWKPRRLSHTNLLLDAKNPRLGPTVTGITQADIIQFLFDNEKALDIASSIAKRGFFPTETLVAVREQGHLVVVEGNRRLAAVKALCEPQILRGTGSRTIRELAARADIASFSSLPVTVAPSRRETDSLVAARHGETAVEAWDAEKRATFIVEKLEEGYDDAELAAGLGFTSDQIGEARLIYALARIVRGLELPDDVQEKLSRPRLGILSNLKRIIEFPSGRRNLRVSIDPVHGLIGTGDAPEFQRAFGLVVSDLVRGDETSRSLNTDEETQRYFSQRRKEARVEHAGHGWLAQQLYAEPSEPIEAPPEPSRNRTRSARQSMTVLPTSLRPRHSSTPRILKMRDELTKMQRKNYPNAGAVALRVFFELTVVDYLQRTGRLEPLKAKLAKGGKYPNEVPTMKELLPTVRELADKHLAPAEAREVRKALSYEKHARFNISDLHSFVHNGASLPTDADLEQFWIRTEPLFRLMLERNDEN